MWAQVLISALGVVGGLGGIGAVAGVLSQRRKLKADAAGVLTDTALELVEPLRVRIRELESEAASSRRATATVNGELDQMRRSARDATAALQEATATLRAWRAAILSPTASLDGLRHMVSADPGVGPARNGRPG